MKRGDKKGTPASAVAIKKLRPDTRSTVVKESFRAKLDECHRRKRILKRNPRSKIWVPTTLVEFRSWEENGRFRAWTSKTIDAPGGPYPVMAAELSELLEFFSQDPLENLTKQNDELRRQNRDQGIQIVEMESVIRSLVDELVLAGQKPISERSNVISIYRKW